MSLDIAIIIVYLLAMLAFGFWGKSRTKNSSDYLVAGRRLGPVFYTGTLAAVVLGGASTVGGVGLGYKFGISGMWLVVAIAVGVILLSLLFAGPIQKLRVYTVAQVLQLRYGVNATAASGIVMALYTLMLVVTSTIAYATVFNVLFGTPRWGSIAIGAATVIIYSVIGGMWSITLTDMVQFVLKTIGVIFLLLPAAWGKAGGYDGIIDKLGDGGINGDAHFDIMNIGGATIVTYFVVYTFGMLIGQDIWQRVFTARTPQVAKWGGTAAGVYCVVYGIAGALIGTAASVLLPQMDVSDDVYAAVAEEVLPIGLSGLVLAAGVAAMMSTASGALIACSTVCRTDVLPMVRRMVGRPAKPLSAGNPEHDVQANRMWVLCLGIIATLIATAMDDVVAALTVAYDILVGGLLVAILGGFVWKRATGTGALASMGVGTVVTIGTMFATDLLANEPIYFGLGASLVTYIVVSLVTKPTDPAVLAVWDGRLAGTEVAQSDNPDDVLASVEANGSAR
ncbi:sodium:solute symporter [uncultured Corynebacterium sp.]|uniref:sodium:solute symporter n=1 Tax=uncultured Corynebacterium sp. TaxID=159447 RepID=UPI0025F53627|nr:sodium:solute symporter [uncultured Corynebacterium sp.]